MRSRRGTALLSVIIISAVLLAMAVFLCQIVYNGHATAEMLIKREQSFWLARAGIEAAKVNLAHDPNWFTDLPHFPDDDERWIKEDAVGQRQELAGGRYKVVREQGRSWFYCIGEKGQAVYLLKGEII